MIHTSNVKMQMSDCNVLMAKCFTSYLPCMGERKETPVTAVLGLIYFVTQTVKARMHLEKLETDVKDRHLVISRRTMISLVIPVTALSNM